jgi:VWFA-related protein
MNKFRLLFCLAAIARLSAQDTVIRTESRVVLVDAIVTDKKGGYVRDLKQKDFKVWEDNKEQTITSFTFEADAASPANDRKHYLVLFFDNSTSSPQDQIYARAAALKFIDSNAGKNRLMAIVEFSGSLQVTQNFTEDTDRLKKVVNGVKFSSVSPSQGPGALRSFAARSVLLALRDLAKGLSSVPGRKTLVFISGGFPLNEEGYTELTATIDSCNRANVAIYPIDVRGLVAPGASLNRPLLQLAAYQTKGGGTTPAPGRGGGGTSNPTPPSTVRNPAPVNNNPGNNNPVNRPRVIMPPIVPNIGGRQQVLYALASGTGGFPIVNSNDILSGMEKIGKEQNEFYLLGYTPSKELEPGACHTIKVKVDQGGTNVRFRSGYCDVKPKDVLSGTQTERDLENRAKGTATPTVKASMQAPFLYVSPNTARVDLTVDIPADALVFTKEKGKLRATMNVIGVVYLPDGGVAARFSDTVKREFEDKKEVEAFHKTLLHYQKEFEVASGKYDLKVAFSSGGDNFGKLERPLLIDPYESGQFVMSALVLSKDARPASAESAILEDRVPLMVSNVQVTPAGTNHFSKSDHAVVYGEIYEPAYLAEDQKEPIAVGVQMQILDVKTNKVVIDSGLVRLDAKPHPGMAMAPFGMKMDFANLAPGSYRVYMASGDSAGHKFNRTVDVELEQ